MPVPEAAVKAIARRLRRRAHLQRRSRHAGRDARSHDPRGRAGASCRIGASRRRSRSSAQRRSDSSPRRPAAADAADAALPAAGGRPRRAPGSWPTRWRGSHERRAAKPRGAAGPAIGWRWWRRRAPSIARSSTRRRRAARARLRTVVGRARLRAAAVRGRTAATRAARIQRAWRDPGDRRASSARAAATAASQLLPLLDRPSSRRAPKVFIGYSDLTSLLTFLTASAASSRSTGRWSRAASASGATRLRPRLVRPRVTSREPAGELAPPDSRSLAPARRAAGCSAAR